MINLTEKDEPEYVVCTNCKYPDESFVQPLGVPRQQYPGNQTMKHLYPNEYVVCSRCGQLQRKARISFFSLGNFSRFVDIIKFMPVQDIPEENAPYRKFMEKPLLANAEVMVKTLKDLL